MPAPPPTRPSETQETDLDRISRLIADLDSEESLLLGFDPVPTHLATPQMESALASLHERRIALEEELAEVWAKHCSKC